MDPETTRENAEPGGELEAADPNAPLPNLVVVTQEFSARLPTQRVVDTMARAEPGSNFADIAQAQPFRIVAFRALLRDYPGRDPSSLWQHSYDVECQVVEANPTNGRSPTLARDSADIGA